MMSIMGNGEERVVNGKRKMVSGEQGTVRGKGKRW